MLCAEVGAGQRPAVVEHAEQGDELEHAAQVGEVHVGEGLRSGLDLTALRGWGWGGHTGQC